jgi:hypothetical protein
MKNVLALRLVVITLVSLTVLCVGSRGVARASGEGWGCPTACSVTGLFNHGCKIECPAGKVATCGPNGCNCADKWPLDKVSKGCESCSTEGMYGSCSIACPAGQKAHCDQGGWRYERFPTPGGTGYSLVPIPPTCSCR